MAKIYEIGRGIDFEKEYSEEYFFAQVSDPMTYKILAEAKETSIKELGKLILKKFPKISPLEDEVKSISEKSIEGNFGKFPLSDKELIEIYKIIKSPDK